MRSIIKKLFLCLTCLSAPGKDHNCPVGKCRRCGGAHNILICNKKDDEKGLMGKEQDESSEEDTEDEAYDDFTSNKDNINLTRTKPKEGKEKTGSKESKKGKEQKDKEDDNEGSKTDKEQKIKRLRSPLGGISEEYEKGKQEFYEKNKSNKKG